MLLVEDEALVAMLVEELILELGAAEVFLASSVRAALAHLTDHRPGFSFLDLNLGGQFSYPVAERLEIARVPFMFLTGYGPDGIEAPWRSRPILQKPPSFESLRKVTFSILAHRGIGV